jgi:hypothetical protein
MRYRVGGQGQEADKPRRHGGAVVLSGYLDQYTEEDAWFKIRTGGKNLKSQNKLEAA